MIRLQTKYKPSQRTALIIVPTLLITLATLLGVIHPLWREQQRITRDWKKAQDIVDSFTPENDEKPIAQRLAIEQRRFDQLQQYWDQILPRIQQYRNQTLSRMVSRSFEGRIDFKIALFEARQRLEDLASQHQTLLPPNLGISATIGADEQAETRLGQLAATLLLLETCMRLDIPIVYQVRALPPHHIPLESEPFPAISLFPVFLELDANFDQWTSLCQDLQESQTLFVLKHLQLESNFPKAPEALRIKVIWSAVGMTTGEPPESLQPQEQNSGTALESDTDPSPGIPE